MTKPTPIVQILRNIRPLARQRKRLPSQEALRARLHYDPDTGIFRFACAPGKGKIAGSVRSGYVVINFGHPPFQYRAHRLAWVYMTGSEPVDQIDHIDGNRSNNKWGNLREASNSQNAINAGLRSHNKSGFKGVSWFKPVRKWRATIKVDGRQKSLGYFEDPQEAYAAYCAASLKYHGEFARVA